MVWRTSSSAYRTGETILVEDTVERTIPAVQPNRGDFPRDLASFDPA